MTNVILRTNATPVYAFLSLIAARYPPGDTPPQRRILDCGAGGPVPPLALFHQHGFDPWGIDTSGEQLDAAKQFSREHDIDLHLRQAAAETSLEAWMELYEDAGEAVSREDWRARYETRVDAFRYVHLYYVLRKPA